MNPNCDGGHCQGPTGEVRVYPLGGGANLILCLACWAHENRYRYERATITDNGLRKLPVEHDKWPQQNWDAAEVRVA